MTAQELPRKWVIMDSKGRITIPLYMRKRLGIDGECPLIVELYPSNDPKKLIITREYRPFSPSLLEKIKA